MDNFLNDIVKRDKSIYNATLAISSDKTSFEWSGVASIAVKEEQLEMTPETPFFIASITKLFTED